MTKSDITYYDNCIFKTLKRHYMIGNDTNVKDICFN